MKRLTTILLSIACCTMVLASDHMMFRTLPIDGPLKSAVKQVKKWGLMGMRIKNVAAFVGTLDEQEVLLILMATPKTNTLFSVTVIYEGAEQWSEQLIHYHAINSAIADQYGEPTEEINFWEEPYSPDNNPLQAFIENKAKYGCVYKSDDGHVAVNISHAEGKLCTLVVYLDEQNSELFHAEGGGVSTFDELVKDLEEE